MNLRTATWLTSVGLMIGLVLMTSCEPLPAATAGPMDEPQTKAQPAVPVITLPLVSPLATPTPGSERIKPSVAPAEESPRGRQPAYDEPRAPPLPAQMARLDLARRLRVEANLIRVTQIETREPDTARIPCLDRAWITRELGALPDTVQWISLSYKGRTYHYVSVRELVIYCE